MSYTDGLKTPYKDCAVEQPNPKEGAETSFGKPMEGQAPEAGGEWGTGVQYAKVAGAEGEFAKVPGSGGQDN